MLHKKSPLRCYCNRCIIFRFAARSPNEIQLVTKNFEAEVEQQQNLIFTFDKDLVPDSLTGMWDTVPYLAFTPEVKGKYKWNSSKELMFSPLSGFLPSSD